MAKVMIETTGPFLLLDPTTRTEIHHNRPTVTDWSSFIEARTGLGQIRIVIPKLMDDAEDAEFAEYIRESDGDLELAISSFRSKYEPAETVGKKAPAKKIEDKKDDVEFAPRTRSRSTKKVDNQ